MNLSLNTTMNSMMSNLTLDVANFRKSYLAFYLLTIPLSFMGIIGNVVLIITVFKRKQFHTPSYILSANMAVSDVIVLVFGSIFLIINIILSLNPDFIQSSYRTVCQVNYFVLNFSYTTSSQSFMAISIDRYRIMTSVNGKSPFQKKKTLMIIVGITWLIGLTFAIPMLQISNINPRLPLMCDFQPYGTHLNGMLSIYHVASLLIAFIIPLLTVSILYFKIIRHISQTISTVQSNPGNKYNQSRKRQIRATKMMILATLLFMLNSLPIMAVWVVSVLIGKSYAELVLTYGQFLFIVISSAFFLASLTAIQNPFIFITYNKSLRAAMISNFRFEGKTKMTTIAIGTNFKA